MKEIKRVLLKISGEALMGKKTHGLDSSIMSQIASDIKDVYDANIEICVVVGGGNIFRGMNGVTHGINRSTSDHMGMLATVMNGLALQSILEDFGLETRVMSGVRITGICEPFVYRRALRHIEKGRILIFTAGTGNPHFTTDTAASLRALEMNCDVLIKGTKVDGVYSEDPFKNPDAKFYEKLSYKKVLDGNLRIMDATAVALAQENNLPLMVCSIQKPKNLVNVIKGNGKFSLITT